MHRRIYRNVGMCAHGFFCSSCFSDLPKVVLHSLSFKVSEAPIYIKYLIFTERLLSKMISCSLLLSFTFHLYFSCQLWAQQNQDAVCTEFSDSPSRRLVATTTKILRNLWGLVHVSVWVLKIDLSNTPLALQGPVNEIKKTGVLKNPFYSKGKLHRVPPVQQGFITKS